MNSLIFEDLAKSNDSLKKKVNMRYTLLKLPKKYVICEEKSYICCFSNAKLLTEQMDAIKHIFSNFNQNNEELQFLSDLYFDAPLNHPTRNQIYKLFQKNINNVHITSCLSLSIKSLIEQYENNFDCEQTNNLIASISGCFENFTPGKEALLLQLHIFFPFLRHSIEKYLEYLRNENSPSLRNECYVFLHNSIRVTLSCFQEFHNNIKLYETEVNNLNAITERLIRSNDVPFDTKTNLGILLAHIAKSFGKQFEYILKVSQCSQSKSNASLTLCRCIGITNTFAFKEYQKCSKELINIVEKISCIGMIHSTEMCTHLVATRSLLQISKDMSLLEDIKEHIFYQQVLKIILDYSLLFIEHNMDNIRHMCKEILRSIIYIFRKFELNVMMKEFLNKCFNLNPISIKFIVLSNISNIIEYKEIFQIYPNIFENLFTTDLTKDPKLNTCYERLMISSHKQLNFLAWKNIWIDYLVSLSQTEIDDLECIENLINKAVVTDALIAEYTLHEDCNLKLRTKLSILWTIRKNGLQVKNFEEIMKDFQKYFIKVFLSNCDDTKILVLKLIVETHKSTEIMTEKECENILFYLKYNANCQNPSIRYKALVLIKKALKRIELNLIKLLKTKKKKKSEHYYEIFLKNLFTLLIDNLFLGANLSRKLTSLSLLKTSIQIVSNTNSNLLSCLPEHSAEKIFNILNDPYEGNKFLAVDILNQLKITVNVSNSLLYIENLLVSTKPTDSISAIYHIEHKCNQLNDSEEAKIYFSISQQVPSIQAIYFCAIKWCVNILKGGIEIAQNSVLLAAKFNPLYGSLGAIRYMILKLNFQLISTEILWKELIREIVEICKVCIKIVRPIITSASPEGHIPESFCKLLTDKNLNYQDNTTPQMILLCAWRTIKEICVILGEIVLRAPIENNQKQSEFILNFSEVYHIGEHFKELLSETKHRGAFEQTYVGFIKLCISLWKAEQQELNTLPIKWMKDLINVITQNVKEIEKMSATRRSAGIPFMMQALITSELQVGSTKALELCMNNFIKLCNDSKMNNADSKTHGFNILRALYRCTNLNEVITEYIADGVICSIRGYNSTTWSEKNSATLLFSALIIRIFGVQESKQYEIISLRNKMTGKMFFLRYPKLYDFFLSELKLASTFIQNDKNANTLHPLLLILCRLYPTASEGTRSNLKLETFLPFLSECSACPVMNTRILVAKAITALISVDDIPKKVFDALIICKGRHNNSKNNISLNYVQGLLLQVLELLKFVENFEPDFIVKVFSELENIQNEICGNIVILQTILDIKIELLTSISNDVNIDFSAVLRNCTISVFNCSDSLSCFYSVFRKTVFLYNLNVVRLKNSDSMLFYSLLEPIYSEEKISNEQMEVMLNIITLLIFKKKNLIENDDIEITENEIKFINSLEQSTIEILYEKLIKSVKLENFLKNIIKTKNLYYCTEKAYRILSTMKSNIFDFQEYIKESKISHEDIKISIAMCVESFIQNHDFSEENPNNLKYIFDYIEDISHARSKLLRLKASEILSFWSKHFVKYLKEKYKQPAVTFSCITLNLIMDDNFDVRNNISKMIQSINIVHVIPKDIIIVSNYAQQIFIENIANILKVNHYDTDNAFVKIMFTEIIQYQLNKYKLTEINGDNEDDIFDKHDVNVFEERTKIIEDIKSIYFKYFDADI